MEGVGHLGGEALLKLGTTRVTFHDPGQIREPHHLAVRYVPDVGFADHRQQMMLAGRVEEDVPDVDHLVVVCLKTDGQLLDGILAQPGARDPPRPLDDRIAGRNLRVYVPSQVPAGATSPASAAWG